MDVYEKANAEILQRETAKPLDRRSERVLTAAAGFPLTVKMFYDIELTDDGLTYGENHDKSVTLSEIVFWLSNEGGVSLDEDEAINEQKKSRCEDFWDTYISAAASFGERLDDAVRGHMQVKRFAEYKWRKEADKRHP